MIKKLRRKFTLVSMLSLFLLLLIIMVTVNLLNYSQVVGEADAILDILAENGGSFPNMGEEGRGFEGEEPPEKPADREDRTFFGGKRELRDFSPEVQYETRFFSVSLDESGEAVSADVGRIAAVDSEEAAELAKEAAGRGGERGFIGSYRYVISGSLVVFTDVSRSLDNVRSFLIASVLISLAGLVIVFLVMLLVSGRVIRPISESYEKQRQFITDAGHEIKTPIAIINADAEVLELENGEGEWTDDIKAQTKRLASLTDDLIFLSRMEEESPKLSMVEFPFSDMAEEAARSFESLAKTQNKSFSYDIEPDISVVGDEKGLRQLVNILLDNAIKYSPENGKINMSAERNGKSLRLTVANTAEDVSKEQLSHMFDRFYRGDKSRSEKSGYGIGLSIAKAVTDAHKGKITASSPDGRSVKMTVVI